MKDLSIALDIEAKYWKWLAVSPAARRLDARCPDDTRKVFIQLYCALSGVDAVVHFPSEKSL